MSKSPAATADSASAPDTCCGLRPDRLLLTNVVSNYATVAWSSGLTFLAIPILLNLLGSAQWGIVALCTAVQGALNILDAGMSQIAPRHFAAARSNSRRIAELFGLLSTIYAAVGVLGFLVVQVGATLFVTIFSPSASATPEFATALRVLSVQFLFQFSNNANVGFWTGTESQKLGNLRSCVFVTARYAFGLAVVYTTERSAVAYLITSALISMAECVSNHLYISGKLESVPIAREKWLEEAKNLAADTGGFTMAVLVGMVVSQLDRLYLSAVLPVAAFGTYSLAANLALAFMQLQHPLLRAALPTIVAGTRDNSSLLATAVFSLCVSPCIVAAIFAPELFGLWLGNKSVAMEAELPFRMIVSAVAINALYNLIYQHMLAANASRAIVAINCASIVCGVAVIAIGEFDADSILGGMIWITTSLMQLTMGIIWKVRYEKKKSQ